MDFATSTEHGRVAELVDAQASEACPLSGVWVRIPPRSLEDLKMNFCDHPNLGNNPRRDYCPLCKYEFYYGDAHATDPNLQLSKLINPGRDRKANGYPSEEELREDDYEY